VTASLTYYANDLCAEVIFQTVIEAGGSKNSLKIVRNTQEIQAEKSENGNTLANKVIELKLFMKPANSSTSEWQLHWWTWWIDPGENAVTGQPVFSVCMGKRGQTECLYLLMANTYYHFKHVYAIDLTAEVVPIKWTDTWSTITTRNQAKSVIWDSTVPEDTYNEVSGARSTSIEYSDETLILQVESSSKKSEKVFHDLRRNRWMSASENSK
jgi:hypothetical protein